MQINVEAKSVLEFADQLGNTTNSVAQSASMQNEAVANVSEDMVRLTEQANMLALNASIEAARAGEAGRGFAVVADQISSLAASSAQASENIDKLIVEFVEKMCPQSQSDGGFLCFEIKRGSITS